MRIDTGMSEVGFRLAPPSGRTSKPIRQSTASDRRHYPDFTKSTE